MKRHISKTTLARLAAAETQFQEIDQLTKQLRKHLANIAETVRIAVDELRILAKKKTVRSR
jgi:hypothetical protein